MASRAEKAPVDPTPPARTVRLVFVHHSCGNNWLNADNGNLGDALGKSNYYVRDTHYGWNAPENADIGSSTDIGHWHTWFADETVQGNGRARRDNIMDALYKTDGQHASYTPVSDPGGENDVVLFKSCYPNSNVRDDNSHPPEDLCGQPCASEAHTLGNCREVYRRMLAYVRTRPGKMFVVVTAPPLVQSKTDASCAGNARALNNWLVNEWLVEADWKDRNVYVFDLFNVLTAPDNHHRVAGGSLEHVSTNGDDYAAYGTGGDSHPTAEGNQKATGEFVPLLNVYYNRWRACQAG